VNNRAYVLPATHDGGFVLVGRRPKRKVEPPTSLAEVWNSGFCGGQDVPLAGQVSLHIEVGADGRLTDGFIRRTSICLYVARAVQKKQPESG